MGLTVAEAFMLLAFVLLMLMMLWRSEDARQLEAAKAFTAMSEPERAGVERIVEAFRQAGLSPDDPALREKLGDLAVAGRESPEVLARLAAADEPSRRKLEALIRGDAWRGEGDDRTVAERVAGRLQSAAESRARVTEALRRELGATVAAAGGEIDPDGALVFPETVLFPAGKSDVTPQLRAFLQTICQPWFQTLERSGADISDLRIEGHASTEWFGLTPEQAYLANLALSQARAHAVLSTCLELVPGPEGQWARGVATAVGYSSSHPVVVSGREDAQKSRRVVFRVDYSEAGVLRDIQTDVDAATPAPETP